MSLVLLFVIWFAPEIITVMAGKQYASAVNAVAPVAMSILLLYYSQIFINMLFYFEEKKSLVFSSLGAAALNIVLNYFCIPVTGFVAASYTTLLSFIVFAVSNCFAMRRILRKRNIKDNVVDYKTLIFILIVFVVIGFAGMYLYSWIIPRIVFAAAVLVMLFVFRKKISGVIKGIKG